MANTVAFDSVITSSPATLKYLYSDRFYSAFDSVITSSPATLKYLYSYRFYSVTQVQDSLIIIIH